MDVKIIKHCDASLTTVLSGRRILNRSEQAAYQETEGILEAARQQARAIVAEAEKQKAGILEQARSDGYRDGLANWHEALERAERVKEANAKSAEQQLIRLSVRIAEKIIGQQLRLDAETVLSIVGEALKSTRRERHLVIHVHPEHVQIVRERLDSLRAQSGDDRDYRVIGSSKVDAGGCLVESEIGTIDARLEVQLQVLEELMLRAKR